MSVETLVSKVAACQKACNFCFDACLKEDHVQMMTECIRSDRECADLCGVVLTFAQRDSKVLPEIVAACAKACQLCAEECEQHDHDHCQECARACRKCEAACHEFLATVA
ncbi:four-helix bundle copper-binding protein [Fundicoccus sp. Sow4_F4]|uniref:four-helix bundle copper-binding protein n=1 Tax=Fundicoccus sp. Sow4_F4 TaxID=3438783 RepID=UPI003F9018B3